MKRQIVTTGDGATTIFLEEWNEHYHSKHGAINESLHVFIEKGLLLFKAQRLSILEIGLGTGLNALLTALKAPEAELLVTYTGVEAYPVDESEFEKLNYASLVSSRDATLIFDKIHRTAWGKKEKITENFTLQKEKMFFQDIAYKNAFDLIYFDAFGARVQPELWTEGIFQAMFSALKNEGVLVTYSSKGSVRRAMQSCGFLVEKLPGPPGKREMLRARKSGV